MPVHEEVTEGVVPDTPQDAQGTLEEPTETQSVNAGVEGNEGERPWKNLKGEMDRKFSRIEQMIAELAFANRSTAQPAAQSQNAIMTDEDLAKLAAMGDGNAQLELTNRVAQRAMAVERAQQATITQLRALYARYPQLSDPSNPLTRAALMAKNALRGMNTWPSEYALDLEAIKVAIVDNPDLIATRAAQPAPNAPASSVDGSTTRRSTVKAGEPVITQKEIDLAKRMGAKDPIAFIKKAKKGFDDRQAAGRSGLDPAAMIIIKEQEGR